MKKWSYLGIVICLLAVTITVPSVTLAWFFNSKSYGLALKAGESVAVIQTKAFKKIIGADYAVSYRQVADNLDSSNITDESGNITMTAAETFDFDYLNSVIGDDQLDYNYFPRIFIEVDIIKEYFDAYLLANISSVSLKVDGSDITADIFEMKQSYYSNDPADPLVEAIHTKAALLDSEYTDENGFVDDGKPIGAELDLVTKTGRGQLFIPGFPHKVNNENVFSRVLVFSIGINPLQYLAYLRQNPDFISGTKTFNMSISMNFAVSNNAYDQNIYTIVGGNV